MPRFGLPSPFGLARRRNSELRLGRLEREVLDRIWTHGDTDASGMQSALASDRPIALSTVQSTLERLHRKRLLLRQKRGRAYRYAAAITREELIGDLVDGVIKGLAPQARDPALCGLGDRDGHVDEATLQRLEAWIAAHRAGPDNES